MNKQSRLLADSIPGVFTLLASAGQSSQNLSDRFALEDRWTFLDVDKKSCDLAHHLPRFRSVQKTNESSHVVNQLLFKVCMHIGEHVLWEAHFHLIPHAAVCPLISGTKRPWRNWQTSQIAASCDSDWKFWLLGDEPLIK